MTTQEDLALVERALTGDRIAQRRLAARLLDAIHREVAFVMARHANPLARDPRQDVLDLVQDVLVVLFAQDGRELRRWDPDRGRTLESFVRLIARRRVARVLGQRRGNPCALSLVEVTQDDLDDELELRVERRDELELVLDGVYAHLDEHDAELFELVFVDELDADEAGRCVGMTAGAVNAWRYRLRKIVRGIAAAVLGPSSGGRGEADVGLRSGPDERRPRAARRVAVRRQGRR